MPLLHHALIHAVFSVTLCRVAPSSPRAGCRPHSGQQGEGACTVGTISLCKESLLRPQVSVFVQSVMTWRETRSCVRAAVRGRAEGGNPAGVPPAPLAGSELCSLSPSSLVLFPTRTETAHLSHGAAATVPEQGDRVSPGAM